MPLYASIPLPGPFRYGVRLSGRRHRGHRHHNNALVGSIVLLGQLIYWTLWLEVMFCVWMVKGTIWTVKFVYRESVIALDAWRLYRERKDQ